MSFYRVDAFVIVDEQNVSEITETLLRVIDSFAIRNIPVFDSGVTPLPGVDVTNAEEVRNEMTSPGT